MQLANLNNFYTSGKFGLFTGLTQPQPKSRRPSVLAEEKDKIMGVNKTSEV